MWLPWWSYSPALYTPSGRRMLIRLLGLVGAVVYFATMIVLIQWFSLSIVVTKSGPVQWQQGWAIVECQWKDCK